jgi:hypothetical protein
MAMSRAMSDRTAGFTRPRLYPAQVNPVRHRSGRVACYDIQPDGCR